MIFNSISYHYQFKPTDTVLAVLKHFLPFMVDCSKQTYSQFALVKSSDVLTGLPPTYTLEECGFVASSDILSLTIVDSTL